MKEMNGKNVRDELLKEYQKIIQKEKLEIGLAIIQVGSKEESSLYIRNKIKYAKMLGIDTKIVKLEENITEEELQREIEDLNNDPKITGIILQSPVPKQIDFTNCVRKIVPQKDVDGLTEENILGVRDGREKILPCTVKGILKLLEYYKIPLEGKKVVIVGRSNIVGKPLAEAFMNRNATVTICHSKTKDLKKYTKMADIVISATGIPNLITKDMVKKDGIGIDVGINHVDGKVVGDFDSSVKEKASYLTPVPGGVGPMTIAMLIDNLIELKRKEK